MSSDPYHWDDHWSERARRILILADEERKRLGQKHVDSAHLLLGILREGEGIAAQVLMDIANLETMRVKLEAALRGEWPETGP